MTCFYVHRIHRWPDGAFLVEVSEGMDSADPGVLTEKYRHLGEFVAYDNPKEAAIAAVRIQRQWEKDNPGFWMEHPPTLSAIGLVGELGIPSEEMTALELFTWARKRYELIPRCARCNNPYSENERYTIYDSFDDEGFCSEYCAEETYLANLREMQGDEVFYNNLKAYQEGA